MVGNPGLWRADCRELVPLTSELFRGPLYISMSVYFFNKIDLRPHTITFLS